MTLDLYLAFVIAATILIAIPGPNVSFIVATSVAQGARSALMTVAGSSTAIALQLAALALGMTSLMAILADWFEWLRWAGVLYLLYLGVQHWRAATGAGRAAAPEAASGRRLFGRGFVINATNPKILAFYAAFFPQFIDPAAAAGPQLAILGTTFLIIATLLDGGYAIAGGRLRGLLLHPRRVRLRNRITGSLLIGAGLGLAFVRRS